MLRGIAEDELDGLRCEKRGKASGLTDTKLPCENCERIFKVTSDTFYNGRAKKDPWWCEWIPGLECEGPPSEHEEKESDEEYDPEEDTDL